MSTRMKFSDVRWFADRRPTCIVVNEEKRRLGTVDDSDYAQKMQKNGLQIFSEKVRITPKVTVKSL